MRRRGNDGLVDNELKLVVAALRKHERGQEHFYGFELAKDIAALESSKSLMSHSTLYRGLRRLEDRGIVESWWETPEAAAEDGREGRLRRYYRLSGTPEAIAAMLMHEAGRGVQRKWWTQWGLGAVRA